MYTYYYNRKMYTEKIKRYYINTENREKIGMNYHITMSLRMCIAITCIMWLFSSKIKKSETS